MCQNVCAVVRSVAPWGVKTKSNLFSSTHIFVDNNPVEDVATFVRVRGGFDRRRSPVSVERRKAEEPYRKAAVALCQKVAMNK